MNRRRLDAESLRDVMLAVAGTLTACGGGPGLPLEYPENTGGLRKGDVNPPSFRLARFRPEQEFVRTVYLPIIRSGPQAGPAEVRNVFDFTQPGEFAGQRVRDHRADPGPVPDECQVPEAAGPRAGPADDGRLGRSMRGSTTSGSAC